MPDVAQHYGHAARTEPLRDAGTHYASADDCRMHDFFSWRFSFLVLFRQKKIADQILSRFRAAKIDNRVELEPQRLVDRIC